MFSGVDYGIIFINSIRGAAILFHTLGDIPELIKMVGGAPITQEFCDKIGADCYISDAASASEAALAYLKR